MGHELSNYELEGADYLLKIHTEDVSLLDASKMEYLYKRGYEEAKRQIRNIRWNWCRRQLRNIVNVNKK